MAFGQSENDLECIAGHKEKAGLFLEISSYEQAIEEYKKAIALAGETGQQQEAIDIQITLAELLRKSHRFEEGFELLNQIEGSEEYPLLQVRKLGRTAALLHEGPFESDNKFESIQAIINEALKIATLHGFELEIALLKRELGYLQNHNGILGKGHKNLQEAAALFRKLGDIENYVGTLTKVIDYYLWSESYEQADSVSAIALELVEGKDWHAAKVDLYGTLVRQKEQQGDTFGTYYWGVKATQSHLALQEGIYSRAMSANKVLYETEKFKNQAAESAQELNLQQQRMRELTLFFSILGLAAVAMLILFFRERKMKAQLKVANEKYQMLNVESNHRIKNNLQMVTSLIKYAKKEEKASHQESLEDISNKIQTVSALHKHLHLDVHNDFVNLGTYVQEIIRLYKDISQDNFNLKDSIHQVRLRSERIVYFGLLFNEMLSNTIEHCRHAELNISLQVERLGSNYTFAYEDGSAREDNATKGTGSVLIEQLIRRVEGTNYHFDPVKGRFQFDFYD